MLFMTCQNRDMDQTTPHGAMLCHQNMFGRFVYPRGIKPDIPLWDNWCLDNGAFTGFDESAFTKALRKLMPYRANCRFVVAPDIPFDWQGTLKQFPEWARFIHALGYPVAIALQDGATVDDLPWSQLDAVFVGGSTLWKREQYNDLPMFKTVLTPRDEIIQEAKQRGMWVHIGRQANSRKQLIAAKAMGADSVDGTGERFKPNAYFPWIAQTMWELSQWPSPSTPQIL